VDPRRELGIIRSWWKPVVLVGILAAVAAFVASNTLPKTYEAESRLLVGQALQATNPDVNLFQSATDLAGTYAVIGETRQVLERVTAKVGLQESVDALLAQISVKPAGNQPIIDIKASADSPEKAAAIANALAEELIAIAPAIGAAGDANAAFAQQDLKDTAQQITDTRDEISVLLANQDRTTTQQLRLDVLESRLVSLRASYAALLQNATTAAANRLAVIDPAVPAQEPSSPRVVLNTILAGILGVLLAVGAAFLLEHLDDRVKSAEHVEAVTGLSNLGTVMRMPGAASREPFYRMATLLYPRSPAAEAFRTIRTNIEFAGLDKPFRTVVVTSSAPGEGKTVVASNLAVAFAQSGRRTILVDADLRRPGVHEMFSLTNARGLTDMVHSDDTTMKEVIRATEEPNLSIITAGTVPPNPAELLGSGRMAVILDRLRNEAEIVVFDTAPVGAVTDAAILAAKADATLFVVQPLRTTERVVRRGRGALAKVNARVIGAVLNNVPHGFTDAIAYYGRYGATVAQPAPAAVPVWDGTESPSPEPAPARPRRMAAPKAEEPRPEPRPARRPRTKPTQ
jgi:succinoglycan biosynthesis transport protein ExoP